MNDDTAEATAPEPTEPAPRASVEVELAAMKKLHQALERLDPAAQARVLTWLWARYGYDTGGEAA